MNNSQEFSALIAKINEVQTDITRRLDEAVQISDLQKIGELSKKFFSRKLGKPVTRMPGYEKFSNNYGQQIGVRFFYGLRCFRMNWKQTRPNSAFLNSVDVWESSKLANKPDYHIEFKNGLSLVKAFPIILDQLQRNKVEEREFVYLEESTNLNEAIAGVLLEGRATAVDEDMIKKILGYLTPGYEVRLYKDYGIGTAGDKVVAAIKAENPDFFEKKGKTTVVVGDAKKLSVAKLMTQLGGSSVTVSKGEIEKQYFNPEEKAIEEQSERICFEEQLQDMVSVIKLLLKGSAYSMFIAGKGGVGKTHTVEQTLHEAGLKDGAGFYKITGSASPVGIYRTLYDNRDGVILFDDCDGALADQDARNLIKAATDTKKERKLAWMKKASWIYNPDFEDEGGDREDDGENYPSNFIFTGKVIFISNLPLNKLDPDGALRTRSFVVNVDPTDLEILEFMKKIAPRMPLEEGLYLSEKERVDTVAVVAASSRKGDLSLRKLVRALNIRASGIEGWENIVKRYA